MSDDLEFNYEDLYFIELVGDGNKNPIRKWGGYSQDYDEADNVYRHDEVDMIPGREWGVVGIEDIGTSVSLLIFDLDVHKAPDDFDPSEIGVPADTPVVKSQNGGLHIYFMVHEPRGEGSESDFTMTHDLGWDIDIRGSYVSHHVVAPNAIPGVGGDYELVNDDQISGVFDPAEAAERITYQGEPLLEYQRDTGISTGDFEFDRPTEAPDDMPTCYHAGLELRKAAPEDHPNTHKVNVLTALCGLAAGYGVDDVTDHFVNDYAPGAGGSYCDVNETEYQVKHIAQNLERGRYAPPAISTLRDYGILDEDEGCNCSIDYHGNSKPTLDVVRDLEEDDGRDLEAEAAAVAGEPEPEPETAETDGGATTQPTGGPANQRTGFEADVQGAIVAAEEEDIEHKTARHRIALAFDRHFDFVYPEDEVRGWRSTLYVYNEDEGVYEPRGEAFVEKTAERVAGDYLTNTVTNEVVGKLERMSIARGDRFRTDPNRLVVANGILDLHTGELDPYTPAEYHRTKLDVAWNPDAGEPDAIDEFLHDIVEPGDVPTLYRLVGHTLYKEYVGEKAAMLVGGGQNGKSVFLDLVERFLGEYNVSHRALQDFDDNQFAANQLEGKLANIHPDMGDESVKDMSTFKKLTGRDTMTADVKYESPITFENYATLMFAANEMPVFGEDNHAVWRRWVYVNFPHTFNEHDPEAKEPTEKRVLMRRLTQDEELEALLVRCQQEIQEWWDGREWYPDAMRPEAVREQMKKAAEPVFDFATTCLLEGDDEDDFLLKEDVRKCYREYATQEGLPKLTAEVFGEKLVNLRDFSIESGRRRVDDRQPTVYNGVQWTERGRQVLGLDEPDESDDQTVVGDIDSSKKDVLEIVRELVAENENNPVSEDMVIGRAMTEMGMSTAQSALEQLKKQGDLYEPSSDPGKVLDT